MKIYISFDFEGLAGVTNWKETLNNNEYNEIATEQLNAFLKGFFANDKNGVVYISDSHAYGTNLIYKKLIGNTYLIKGFPRKFYMVEGLDDTFDGIVFFGYHAPAGIMGNMDHTYSSSSFFDIFINEKKVSETDINALVASYYNVPILYIYTDNITKKWIKRNISEDIKIRESKKIISRYAAILPPYSEILSALYEDGKNLSLNPRYKYPLSQNYIVKIVITDTNSAYAASTISNVKLINDRTLEFTCKNPLELYKILMNVVLVASSVKNLY